MRFPQCSYAIISVRAKYLRIVATASAMKYHSQKVPSFYSIVFYFFPEGEMRKKTQPEFEDPISRARAPATRRNTRCEITVYALRV